MLTTQNDTFGKKQKPHDHLYTFLHLFSSRTQQVYLGWLTIMQPIAEACLDTSYYMHTVNLIFKLQKVELSGIRWLWMKKAFDHSKTRNKKKERIKKEFFLPSCVTRTWTGPEVFSAAWYHPPLPCGNQHFTWHEYRPESEGWTLGRRSLNMPGWTLLMLTNSEPLSIWPSRPTWSSSCWLSEPPSLLTSHITSRPRESRPLAATEQVRFRVSSTLSVTFFSKETSRDWPKTTEKKLYHKVQKILLAWAINPEFPLNIAGPTLRQMSGWWGWGLIKCYEMVRNDSLIHSPSWLQTGVERVIGVYNLAEVILDLNYTTLGTVVYPKNFLQ